MTALAMVLIGGGVLSICMLLGITTIGAFREFAKYGLSDSGTACVFLAVGVVRMYALKRNSGWDYSPAVRGACAIVGIFLWTILSYGIIQILLSTHELFISVFAWVAFLCGDIFGFLRAVLDERLYVRSKVVSNGTGTA